ncbi:MAG TPA: hypothetical protein DER10_07280 [Elusimicrobia bacterium]|nr:MAG: hypothetical protein A2X33_07560 [Elusimicrobia bacterium GWA2_51_34]HCE98284.1 hypothetical protein [Elusimicrobiota bacterium]
MAQTPKFASHNTRFRRLWMFPRNVRKIEPWKVAQGLSFLEPLKGLIWTGNQSLQNEFRGKLVSIGIVRDYGPYDPHSGGPRTYEAQLRCLGLIYKTPGGGIEFTIAGDDICETGAPLKILQRQLLNLQYPSPYSFGTQVKINPEIKVKPFLFILNLLKRPEISYLTAEEMAVPVIYGHSHSCEDYCVEKILQLRSGTRLKDLLLNPAEDLFTPRTADNTVESRIVDVLTIANTCKNYLESCLLIVPVEQVRGAYAFNPEIEPAYQAALKDENNYFANPENEEGFQRAYGAWNRNKDTRRVVAEGRSTPVLKESFIKAGFYEYCGTHAVTEVSEPLVTYILERIGGPKEEVLSVVEKLIPQSLDIFETKYLELSVGGVLCAAEFEQATNNLFNSGLGLKSQWTGSKRKSRTEKGAFTDIVVYSPLKDACGIVDTKAVVRYNLPSADYAKMISNYIPNYRAVAGQRFNLAFCSYVAGGFAESFPSEAVKIFNATKIPCSGLKAIELLKMSKDKHLPQANWQTLCKNGLIR